MKKRVYKIMLSLLLCICMCGLAMTAFAATEYVDGYLRYIVTDGSVTITGYNGREGEVTVPSQIAGIPVNTIAAGAFINSLTVTKVNLPDTIMTIEEGAFGIGQTVVYNSNTDDTVVTEPTNPPAEELTPTPETTLEPTQESVTEPTQASTQKTEETTKQPYGDNLDISVSNKAEDTDSDKNGSVEEVDVDFKDVSEQEPSVNSTEDLKSDNAKEQSVQNTENVNETEENTEKSGNKVLLIMAIIMVMAATVAGICVYRKKGRR